MFRLFSILSLFLTATTAWATPGVLERHTITAGGLEREFLAYEPTGRDGQALPLVFLIHGGGDTDAATFTQQTSMQIAAERDGFILIAPESYGSSWNYGDRLSPWLEGEAVDDLSFFDAMVSWAEQTYNVDPERIFSTGVSAGGIMSYNLACSRPRLLRGIAPVAASKDTAACRGARGVSLLHIHGLADENVPIGGNDTFPPVMDGIDFWRQINGCPEDKTVTAITDLSTETEWMPCADGTEATLILVQGGGHDWAFDFSTTNTVADFIRRH